MSQRAHFWLRIVGLAVILTLEFGPRMWPQVAPAASANVATAAVR